MSAFDNNNNQNANMFSFNNQNPNQNYGGAAQNPPSFSNNNQSSFNNAPGFNGSNFNMGYDRNYRLGLRRFNARDNDDDDSMDNFLFNQNQNQNQNQRNGNWMNPNQSNQIRNPQDRQLKSHQNDKGLEAFAKSIDQNLSIADKIKKEKEEEDKNKKKETTKEQIQKLLNVDEKSQISDEALAKPSETFPKYIPKEESDYLLTVSNGFPRNLFEKFADESHGLSKSSAPMMRPYELFTHLNIIYFAQNKDVKIYNYRTKKQFPSKNLIDEDIQSIHIMVPKKGIFNDSVQLVCVLLSNTKIYFFQLVQNPNETFEILREPLFSKEISNKENYTAITSTENGRLFILGANNFITELDYSLKDKGWIFKDIQMNLSEVVHLRKNWLRTSYFVQKLIPEYSIFIKGAVDNTRNIFYALNHYSKEENPKEIDQFYNSSVFVYSLGPKKQDFIQVTQITEENVFSNISQFNSRYRGYLDESYEEHSHEYLIMDIIPIERTDSNKNQLVLILRNGHRVFISFHYEQDFDIMNFSFDALDQNAVDDRIISSEIDYFPKNLPPLSNEVKENEDDQRQFQGNLSQSFGLNMSFGNIQNSQNIQLNRNEINRRTNIKVFYTKKKIFISYQKNLRDPWIYVDVLENSLSHLYKGQTDLLFLQNESKKSFEKISQEVFRFKSPNPGSQIISIVQIPRCPRINLNFEHLLKLPCSNGQLAQFIKYRDYQTSFSPNCMDEMYLQFFLEPEKYMVCFDDSVSFIYKLRPIDKLAKILLDYELATVNPYVQQPRNRPNPFGNPPVNNSNVNSGNSSLVKDRLSQLNSQPLNSNPRSGRKIEVLKKFESFIEEYGLVETSTMILLILIDNDLEFYFKSQKKNQKADDNSNLHKSQKKVQNNPFDFSDISGNQNDPNIAQSQNDLPQNPFNDALNNINFPSDEELDPKVIPEYSFEKVKINSQIINGGKKLLLKLFDYYSAETQVLIFLKSYMEKQEKNAAAGNGGESQKIMAILDALQERGGGNGQIYQIKDRHQFFTYSLYLLLSRFFRLFWEEEIYYICNKVDNSGYKTQCLEANFYETQFSAVFSLIQDLKLKLGEMKNDILTKTSEINRNIRLLIDNLTKINDFGLATSPLADVLKNNNGENFKDEIISITNNVISNFQRRDPNFYIGNVMNNNPDDISKFQEALKNLYCDYSDFPKELDLFIFSMDFCKEVINYNRNIYKHEELTKKIMNKNQMIRGIIKFKELFDPLRSYDFQLLSENLFECFLEMKDNTKIQEEIKNIQTECPNIFSHTEIKLLKINQFFIEYSRKQNGRNDTLVNEAYDLLMEKPSRIKIMNIIYYFCKIDDAKRLFNLMNSRINYLNHEMMQYISQDQNLYSIFNGFEKQNNKGQNPGRENVLAPKFIMLKEEFFMLMTILRECLAILNIKTEKRGFNNAPTNNQENNSQENNNNSLGDFRDGKFYTEDDINYCLNLLGEMFCKMNEEKIKATFKDLLISMAIYLFPIEWLGKYFSEFFKRNKMENTIKSFNLPEMQKMFLMNIRSNSENQNPERLALNYYENGDKETAIRILIEYLNKDRTIPISKRFNLTASLIRYLDTFLSNSNNSQVLSIDTVNDFKVHLEKVNINYKKYGIQEQIYKEICEKKNQGHILTDNQIQEIEQDLNQVNFNEFDLEFLFFKYVTKYNLLLPGIKICIELYKMHRSLPSKREMLDIYKGFFNNLEKGLIPNGHGNMNQWPNNLKEKLNRIFSVYLNQIGGGSFANFIANNNFKNEIEDFFPLMDIIGYIEILNFNKLFTNDTNKKYVELIKAISSEQQSFFWFINYFKYNVKLPMFYILELYEKHFTEYLSQNPNTNSYKLYRIPLMEGILFNMAENVRKVNKILEKTEFGRIERYAIQDARKIKDIYNHITDLLKEFQDDLDNWKNNPQLNQILPAQLQLIFEFHQEVKFNISKDSVIDIFIKNHANEVIDSNFEIISDPFLN